MYLPWDRERDEDNDDPLLEHPIQYGVGYGDWAVQLAAAGFTCCDEEDEMSKLKLVDKTQEHEQLELQDLKTLELFKFKYGYGSVPTYYMKLEKFKYIQLNGLSKGVIRTTEDSVSRMSSVVRVHGNLTITSQEA